MWNDIESSIDYLHFSVVSRAVADLIEESGISPISIGVSGSWGSGKSSMVNLIGQELKERDEENKQYIFIKFNAWLYQGYADARSALLYTVSKTIESEMKERKIHKNNSAWKKLSAVCKRIDWTADTVCAAIHIIEAFPSLGDKLALALSEIPTKSIKTSIIPLIRNKVWANALLSRWSDDSETPQAVKNAIAQSNRKE